MCVCIISMLLVTLDTIWNKSNINDTICTVYYICFVFNNDCLFHRLRVQHLDCDLVAWKKQCGREVIGLKNEFECNLLPVACKNDVAVHRRLQQTCAVEKFERQLRSGSQTRFSLSSVVMSVLSVLVVIFVLWFYLSNLEKKLYHI